MAEHTFVVTLDASDPALDLASIRKFVTGDKAIRAWWNHIPGVFFIETGLDVHQLTARVKKYSGDVRFVAVEVRPDQVNGWLPEKTWTWLRQRVGGHDEPPNPSLHETRP